MGQSSEERWATVATQRNGSYHAWQLCDSGNRNVSKCSCSAAMFWRRFALSVWQLRVSSAQMFRYTNGRAQRYAVEPQQPNPYLSALGMMEGRGRPGTSPNFLFILKKKIHLRVSPVRRIKKHFAYGKLSKAKLSFGFPFGMAAAGMPETEPQIM